MTELEFTDFFREVHGYVPFPWQRSLAEQVVNDGQWPDLIDVPTGLGKTATLDVALFVLAMTGQNAARAGRRRILFVVDRRLVVDEAYTHACRLRDALLDPNAGPASATVAQRLRGLRGGASADDEPVVVTRMRGGTTWAASWVDRPDQPAIVLGTVDQVGSRLLFRGYGTSDYRKPMDAALTGTDALLLIDEAHLATAMINTVRATRASDTPLMSLRLPGLDVVQLSATANAGTADSVLAFDRQAHLADPVARQRLNAAKQLRLASVGDANKTPQMLATLVIDALRARPGARALVVCNTVDRARRTHAAVIEEARRRGLTTQAAPELIIGRSRPIDRDRRVEELMQRFGVDRSRGPMFDNDVLVATQTVEVGANLDVDVLVTESAPLDALVQRIGRLNRMGRSTHNPIVLVVHDGRTDEPVYGETRAVAWQFLCEQVGEPLILGSAPPVTDDGWAWVPADPLALRDLTSAAPATAFARRDPAPRLFPRIIDTWVHTSPIREPDPPVAPYLHGLGGPAPGVTVLWRDDLDDVDDVTWPMLLDALPYVATETVEVPIPAFRAWLFGSPPAVVADVDISQIDEPEGRPRHVALLRSDHWEPTTASSRDIRPGSVVAVPASYGGLDEFGWAPVSIAAVRDVRELAAHAMGRPMLRLDGRTHLRINAADLTPAQTDSLTDAQAAISAIFIDSDDADSPDRTDRIFAAMVALRKAADIGAVASPFDAIIASLGVSPKMKAVFGHGQLVVTPNQSEDASPDSSDSDETASTVSSRRVRLREHHRDVAERTALIATALGLGRDVKELLVFAAAHHDLGKCDLRFQAALLGGDVLRAELLDEPLAKSGISAASAEARRARSRSGLPHGFRHEAWSAQMAAQLFPDYDGWRLDLLTHLIASHHGRGRGSLPIVLDAEPHTIEYEDPAGIRGKVVTDPVLSADPDSTRRFDDLNRRFGPWWLALLETIVRSADQTCSKEGK